MFFIGGAKDTRFVNKRMVWGSRGGSGFTITLYDAIHIGFLMLCRFIPWVSEGEGGLVGEARWGRDNGLSGGEMMR